MLPAAIMHCGFAAAAVFMQVTGITDLPRLLNVNNILLTGLIYTVVLCVLEAVKKNQMMMFAAPFLIVAYASMLYNFGVFYGRSGVVPYSYRDTYFLLLLCYLASNIREFFRLYYRSRRESELLAVQNRQAEESYRQIKVHLGQVGGLKHELKNHIAAMRLYLKDGRYEEAGEYLERYAEQTVPVADAVYHDNFLLNALVGGLLQRAGEQGVKVGLKLQAAPVSIAGHDFYSLMSNILDNALEACAKVPDGMERFIRLYVTRREPYLNIRCENSKAGEIESDDGRIETSKTGSGHGYGLQTVARVVDAYDGLMNIDHSERIFTITAALKDG
jgi:sensor histidine kinase YesM